MPPHGVSARAGETAQGTFRGLQPRVCDSTGPRGMANYGISTAVSAIGPFPCPPSHDISTFQLVEASMCCATSRSRSMNRTPNRREIRRDSGHGCDRGHDHGCGYGKAPGHVSALWGPCRPSTLLRRRQLEPASQFAAIACAARPRRCPSRQVMQNRPRGQKVLCPLPPTLGHPLLRAQSGAQAATEGRRAKPSEARTTHGQR